MRSSPFSVGKPLSIGQVSRRRRELLGFIAKNDPGRLRLDLYKPAPQAFFEKATPVRIGFWDQNKVFRWDTLVEGISGPRKESIVVSKPTQAPVLDRRQYQRFRLNIPLSFRVIYSSAKKIVSSSLLHATTQHLSVGGVSFETDVLLKGGDIIELELDVSLTEPVHAVARVTRSQQGRMQQRSSNLIALQFFRLSRREHGRMKKFLSEAS